jgi:hypothetical protein
MDSIVGDQQCVELLETNAAALSKSIRAALATINALESWASSLSIRCLVKRITYDVLA